MISKLEVHWRQVTESRVTASSVIEDFDVFEDLATSLRPRTPLSLVSELALEGGEEALGHRVVPAVSPPTHAALDRVLCEQLPILTAGVLAATIRMMQESSSGPALRKRHVQSVQRELTFQPFVEFPADYPARVKVHNHRQVQPA